MTDDFLASRLSQLREQKGLTARDMSLSIGQSEGYINKIENRRIQPSIAAFFCICEYLGVSPGDFFDMGNRYPERLDSLVEDMKKLDDAALAHIAGLVKLLVKKG